MHTNLLWNTSDIDLQILLCLVKAPFFIDTMYIVCSFLENLSDDQLYCVQQIVPLIKLRRYIKCINEILPDLAVSYWFILSLSSWFSLSTIWILCSKWVNLCSMSPGSFKRILFSFFVRWIGCARAMKNKQNVNILKILLFVSCMAYLLSFI